MLVGHSMGGDVSRDYITAPLIIESLRPIVNAVAEQYVKIARWTDSSTQDLAATHPVAMI
jgi:hypothetical protein